jgi:Acyl transferase
MSTRPAAFLGPFGSVTEPFSLVNRHGATLRGTVSRTTDPERGDRYGDTPSPVAVVVAGLGRTRRWTLLPGLHLLANGFTVIRFDLTNSVGLSDGEILDFTLSRACDDLRDVAHWACERFGAERITGLAASVTGRAALRAAALDPGLFRLVGTLCGVVDARATLTAILSGTDLVGQLHAGMLRDLDEVGRLFGHDIRLRGVESLVSDDWEGIRGTVRDLRTARHTRFLDFHGALDPWIRTADVRAVFRAVPHARTCIIDDAGHELNRRQTRFALGKLIQAHWATEVRSGRGRKPSGQVPPVPRLPTAEALSHQRRTEQALDRWWQTQTPLTVGTGRRAAADIARGG